MFSKIRRRVTYGNVVVTLALLFAMSGGAYAAGKYVITSTKQIKPSVIKQLKGQAGPKGPAGAAGAAGAVGAAGPVGPAGAPGKEGPAGKEGLQGKEGPQGKQGEAGKEGSPWTAGGTLPAGKTEVGAWTLSVPPHDPKFSLSFARTAISFVIPLESAPKANFLKPAEKTAECPGTVETPEATAGNLCVYSAEGLDEPTKIVVSSNTYGAVVGNNPTEETPAVEPGGFTSGSWAVTAAE